MADLSKTIQIIFEATDKTGTGIAALSKGVGDLAGNLQSASQPLADLTKGVIATDVAMAALALTMVSWATGAAAKFQTAQNEINTLIGLAPENMDKFSAEILKYAETSTQSFDQINLAVYDAISAGVKYSDALDVVSQAEKLAVAGKAQLGEALNLLVPTLNAYGGSMDEAGRYSDVFFTTVKLGKTTIPELAASLGQLAPTAAAVGVPIETIGAALATLTANGIKTSEATTGLKAALSNIIKPSAEASKAAEELGVGFGVTELKSVGLEGMLQKLYTATGGNTEQMARFFGSTEALNAVLSLTSGSSEKFVGNLKAMQDAAGATEAAYKIMADTLANANVQLSNSIQALGIKLGTELLPKVTEISKGLAAVFQGLGQGLDAGAFDVPLGIVNQFLGDLADLLRTAAENLPAALADINWDKFDEAFQGLRDAFGSIFDGIDLDTPAGLAKVIQTVIDAIAGIVKVSGGVIEGLKPLFEIIGGLVTGFANLDPEVQKALGYFLGLATTVNTLSGYAKSFADVIGAGGGLIKSLSSLGPIALAVGTAFAAFEFGKWAGEVSGYNDAADKLIAKMNGVPDAAGPAAEAIGRIPDNLKKVSESTGLAITSMDEFNKLADSGKIIWDDVAGAWVKAGDASGTLGEATTQLLDVQKDLNPALAEQYKAMGLAADGTKKLGDATQEGVSQATLFAAAIVDLDTQLALGTITQDEYNKAVSIIKSTASESGIALGNLAKSEEEAAKKAKDLAAESEKFALEWGKLLSAERIAVFQASADIQVAQIEADSKRAVAAMEMLGASFQNTGDVLTELIGLWVGLEGMDQSKIEGWIEREYAIREKLAQAQIDMVNAEIRRLEAQTALLERGGVELKIQSDGLEPELEAFMFRIIDKVRVAVSGSYEEFLLGCGS